jgi:hypothetical protein
MLAVRKSDLKSPLTEEKHIYVHKIMRSFSDTKQEAWGVMQSAWSIKYTYAV